MTFPLAFHLTPILRCFCFLHSIKKKQKHTFRHTFWHFLRHVFGHLAWRQSIWHDSVIFFLTCILRVTLEIWQYIHTVVLSYILTYIFWNILWQSTVYLIHPDIFVVLLKFGDPQLVLGGYTIKKKRHGSDEKSDRRDGATREINSFGIHGVWDSARITET